MKRKIDELEGLRGLRHLREAKGLGQAELAALAGMKQDAVSWLEVGAKSAKFTDLQRISKALGCTVDQILSPGHGPEAEA